MIKTGMYKLLLDKNRCLKMIRHSRKRTEKSLIVKNICSLLSIEEHVVVETILNGGSVTQTPSIKVLHCFPQNVSTGVPVHLGNEMKMHILPLGK